MSVCVCVGGGGGGSLTARKQPGQRFFFVFFSPQLVLQFTEGSNGFITEKTILFKGSRGPTFLRGGGSRVQVLISIETHITCDFSWGGGGSGPPITPSGSAHRLIAG